ncbi:MAG: bifunctional NADH dehydrogenase FAD-containing subunit/selenide, water dikinase SelD, partial [Cyanobium sp.]
SHALVLRLWVRKPWLRPQADSITLVSRRGITLYSGLVPALVAGRCAPRRCGIDLRALCGRAGIHFLEAEITALDGEARCLQLLDQPPLPYDWLSLDVGSITDQGGTPATAMTAAMAVKPLEPFLAWCESREPGCTLRLRGGGAAAVELALALRGRGHRCELLLRGEQLHLGSMAANRAGERLLQRAGVPVRRQVSARVPADLLCTGSRAPLWLAAAGLPVDPAGGRVLSEPDLRVCGHGDLFVSGDCGLIASAPRPPAGVWAVRVAPLLAENLRRSLHDPSLPLRRWRPPRRVLQLLADGSRSSVRGSEALALWGPFALGPSRALGWLKDRIDRRFVESFPGATQGPSPRRPVPAAGGQPLSAP